MHLTQLPIRLTTGAFILNSGIGKLGADEATAQYLHGAASSTYPAFFKDMNPQTFTKVLAYSEIGVGSALLFPKVPATIAGAALTGFGASLVGMYLKTPGMTQSDGIRPTQDGIPLAKDTWLVGAGLTLLLQGLAWGTKRGAKAVKRGVQNTASNVQDALPIG